MAFAQSELSYLKKNCEKPAQQIDSWAVAHLAHHVLLRTLIQSMIWHSVRRVHEEHTKLPVTSPRKLAFCRGQWDASYTKTFSEKCLKKRFRESNTASLINQWRSRFNAHVKAKDKHFEHLL